MIQNPRQPMSHLSEPMYGWSLDQRGRPVPIALAERGAQGYRCPICGEPMIARKGDVKIHHFAHETLTQCSPDRVAAIIAGKWLVLQLGERMVLKQLCLVRWQSGKENYSADLLKNVTAIIENMETKQGKADIALLSGDEQIRAVFNIDPQPDEAAINRFVNGGIAVIVLPVQQFTGGQLTLDGLLAQARIVGGWHLLGKQQDAGNLVTDAAALRDLLTAAVTNPPYYFWNRLEEIGGKKYILRLGDNLLWLSSEVWRAAIGGSPNQLSKDVSVTIQQWPQPDGGMIVLFYVVLREEDRAVAVRRFQRGQDVEAKLHDSSYLSRAITALDIARLLVTG